MTTKMPPVVRVTWWDAWTSDSWASVEEVVEAGRIGVLVSSVGYLLHEDPACVVIAGSYDPDIKKVCGVMSIPRRSLADVIVVIEPAREV